MWDFFQIGPFLRYLLKILKNIILKKIHKIHKCQLNIFSVSLWTQGKAKKVPRLSVDTVASIAENISLQNYQILAILSQFWQFESILSTFITMKYAICMKIHLMGM